MCICTAPLLFVQECVSVAFQKADDYRQKFEPYRDFYRQNEALDVEKFREEDHGLSLPLPPPQSYHFSLRYQDLT